MYIEPCCIDRQLPTLIRDSKGGFCFFQTSGDCTLQKLLDAVSRMAGDNGHVLVLTVGEVDEPMLRTLAYYFRRGWTRALLLLTATAQTELVERELAPYMDRVHYAADPLVIDGQVAVVGCPTGDATAPAKTLIIQGAILGKADFSLSLYAAWLGTNADIIRSALDPAIAKLKTKPVIDHRDHPAVARILSRRF